MDSMCRALTMHSCPARLSRRTILAPMRPVPIIPICIVLPPFFLVINLHRAYRFGVAHVIQPYCPGTARAVPRAGWGGLRCTWHAFLIGGEARMQRCMAILFPSADLAHPLRERIE